MAYFESSSLSRFLEIRTISQLKKLFKVPSFIWRLFYLNRNAKIKWLAPKKAKIVVFDVCGLEVLIPLFDKESYGIIHTRGEQIYLAPSILVATLLNLTRVRHPFAAYAMALIQHIRPSIVVTFIDNNETFGLVVQHYPESRFLAIQNGMRCIARDNPPEGRPIYLTEFACFGQHEIDTYTKHGAKVEKFYPIGSLRDTYYREFYARELPQVKFDLCLVSEVDPGLAQSHPEIEHSIKNLAIYVTKFCEKTNKKLCIAARNDPKENQQGFLYELQWYRKYMGEWINLIPNCRKEYTTYQLIDSSAASLSFYSTALVEAFGRGKRSLFCNFTNHDWYDLPVNGLWALKQPSYEEFEARLLCLLAMTEQEFQNSSAEAAKYLMSFNKANPPNEFLLRLISQAIRK